MTNFLTHEDAQNYGTDFLDVSQRAAMHAIAPHLQSLRHENNLLRQQQQQEMRRRLDREVASLVPDFQTIDRDPAWHRWLLGIDTLSGRMRQTLLNEAIATGNAHRVARFFGEFRSAGQSAATQARPRASTAYGTRTYTRPQISEI